MSDKQRRLVLVEITDDGVWLATPTDKFDAAPEGPKDIWEWGQYQTLDEAMGIAKAMLNGTLQCGVSEPA